MAQNALGAASAFSPALVNRYLFGLSSMMHIGKHLHGETWEQRKDNPHQRLKMSSMGFCKVSSAWARFSLEPSQLTTYPASNQKMPMEFRGLLMEYHVHEDLRESL